jgi:hypothetical protein
MKPKLTTICKFAAAIGADRRTVQRRVEANGVEHIGQSGAYRLYAFDQLLTIMRDENDGDSPSRGDPPKWSKEFCDGCECGKDKAIYSIGECLPAAVKRALAITKLKASQKQLNVLVMSLFIGLTEQVEHDAGDMPLESGPLLDHIRASGEWPDNLKPILGRMVKQEPKTP